MTDTTKSLSDKIIAELTADVDRYRHAMTLLVITSDYAAKPMPEGLRPETCAEINRLLLSEQIEALRETLAEPTWLYRVAADLPVAVEAKPIHKGE